MRSQLITIAGKRWRLEYGQPSRDSDGTCDPPDKPRKRIVIRKGLRKPSQHERLLVVLVHEILHAAGWPLSEEFVEGAAEDIGRILWQQGFRFTEENDG